MCAWVFVCLFIYVRMYCPHQVLQLGGIPPLVALLQHSNSQVQQTAAAALRNLVFKNSNNKLEVVRCGGTEEALALLKETNSTFTQKQLTGAELSDCILFHLWI